VARSCVAASWSHRSGSSSPTLPQRSDGLNQPRHARGFWLTGLRIDKGVGRLLNRMHLLPPLALLNRSPPGSFTPPPRALRHHNSHRRRAFALPTGAFQAWGLARGGFRRRRESCAWHYRVENRPELLDGAGAPPRIGASPWAVVSAPLSTVSSPPCGSQCPLDRVAPFNLCLALGGTGFRELR
jgi:hypothetical protein